MTAKPKPAWLPDIEPKSLYVSDVVNNGQSVYHMPDANAAAARSVAISRPKEEHAMYCSNRRFTAFGHRTGKLLAVS